MKTPWPYILAFALIFYANGAAFIESFVNYPSWRLIGANEFVSYHQFISPRIIAFLVIPALSATVLTGVMLKYRPAAIPALVGLDGAGPPSCRLGFYGRYPDTDAAGVQLEGVFGRTFGEIADLEFLAPQNTAGRCRSTIRVDDAQGYFGGSEKRTRPNQSLEPTATVGDYFIFLVKFMFSDFRVAVAHL